MNQQLAKAQPGSGQIQRLTERRIELFKRRHGAAELTPALDTLQRAREGIRESREFQSNQHGAQQDLEAVYRTEHGETPKARPHDPVVERLNDELRSLKPGTEEWTKRTDEIDRRVAAMPVSAEDVATMQQAADGIPLPGDRKWNANEMAQALSVARYHLGDYGMQATVSGMMAIRGALSDVGQRISFPKTPQDALEILEREWGKNTNRQIDNIREARLKVPRPIMDAIRNSGVSYHPRILRWLADIGARIPIGPQ